MNTKQRIGANVSRMLRQRSLLPIELVRLSGLPSNTVYRIVRGQNEPEVDTLAAIAHALGCQMDDLLKNGRNRH